MMFVKAFFLVSAIAYLVCAEKKPLKDRLYKCKLLPSIKHHSIFDGFVQSIMPPVPIDSFVPKEYAIDTTLGAGPVPATAAPAAPQQQEVQLPLQPEVQYTPQPEVQYTPQPEVQSPAPQQEGQPPAQQQVAQEQQPLYPPQHEGQHAAAQQQVAQTPAPAPQNEGLYPPQHNNGQYYPQQNGGQYYPQQNDGQYYPPQHNVQYYPAQNEGQYYSAQNQGVYYQPMNYYQGAGTNNVPYNYPVYGQNVLRSVKSLDGTQTNPSPSQYMVVQKPYPYSYVPRPYAAPYFYNYVPRAPKTPQALLKVNAKST